MEDAAERAVHSARELARRLGTEHHDVLVVLGTGLSEAAEILAGGNDPVALDTLPFWPPYGAGGHRAHAWSLAAGRRRVLVLGGRCHLYEGLSPAEVAHPVRTGVAAGCSTVILTSAVGAIRDDLRTGSVMVVADHLNLTGSSPLRGPHHVDLVDAYSPRLRALALAAPGPAASVVDPRPGVYAQLAGPQLETPAEIRMLRALGADVVGMSMALETVAARGAGAEVLGLALVTNRAAGEGTPVDLDDVRTVGRSAAPAVADLVRRVVGSLP
ncbi:MAG TPA: purine-nucleoside phosphorylase [Acidimicrobiales bacterium]|nr:purine-nucleoside phosphorylase [Acidimicrobiales bacterium]